MFPLNLCDRMVAILNLDKAQLPQIAGWYNMTGSYGFATGNDLPVAYEALLQKFEDIRQSPGEFLAGIYYLPEKKLVGMLKGRFKGRILWINMMAVDREYRNRGLGSRALRLLLNHAEERGYASEVLLSVLEENVPGRNFWRKNGFREVKRIEKKVSFQGKLYNVLLMKRSILFLPKTREPAVSPEYPE